MEILSLLCLPCHQIGTLASPLLHDRTSHLDHGLGEQREVGEAVILIAGGGDPERAEGGAVAAVKGLEAESMEGGTRERMRSECNRREAAYGGEAELVSARFSLTHALRFWHQLQPIAHAMQN